MKIGACMSRRARLNIFGHKADKHSHFLQFSNFLHFSNVLGKCSSIFLCFPCFQSRWEPCCGKNIPLSDDKHRFVRDNSKSALEIHNDIQDNFFPDKIFFLTKKSFSLIFSQTEFCLGLNFALDFVSD